MGIGSSNGRYEGAGVKRAGVEEVWGFCAATEVSNGMCRCEDGGGSRDCRWGESEDVRRPDLRV